MANADEKIQKSAVPAIEKTAAQEEDMEIDLVALFYRLLEKIHWILLTGGFQELACPRAGG